MVYINFQINQMSQQIIILFNNFPGNFTIFCFSFSVKLIILPYHKNQKKKRRCEKQSQISEIKQEKKRNLLRPLTVFYVLMNTTFSISLLLLLFFFSPVKPIYFSSSFSAASASIAIVVVRLPKSLLYVCMANDHDEDNTPPDLSQEFKMT